MSPSLNESAQERARRWKSIRPPARPLLLVFLGLVAGMGLEAACDCPSEPPRTPLRPGSYAFLNYGADADVEPRQPIQSGCLTVDADTAAFEYRTDEGRAFVVRYSLGERVWYVEGPAIPPARHLIYGGAGK